MTEPSHDARMTRSSSDRSGVLILRLWVETSHPHGLRARITQSLDSMAGEESVAVASSADDICVVVKRWVDDFTGPGSPDGDGHPGRGE